MQILRAQVADAEAIARLVNRAFRSEHFFIDEDRTNPDKVREFLQQGECTQLQRIELQRV